jgi:beta-lactamase superfamily II metal-dependent hydrolase
MNSFDLPFSDILEVTLIGTGGGYGESIVVHLGNKQWIIVDSCINPITNVSLPLEYLKNLGVDLKNDVKLIVCTHWHDDHIQGLSQIIKECINAKFCYAIATDKTKFLQALSLDYEKAENTATASSTKEFGKCLYITTERKQQIKYAVCDKILYSDFSNEVQVISLSPSEYALSEYNKEIATLFNQYASSNLKYDSFLSPNLRSVVLFIKAGKQRVLLGADLETVNDKRHGWLNILFESQSIDGKASLFKISHHASENGYRSEIFTKLLIENPISKLTPWNRNIKLPDESMINKYRSHSSQLYMTSPVISSKPKKRNKTIEKIINRQKSYKLNEIKFQDGIIRSRIKLAQETADWNVSLFGTAFQIN